MRRDAWMFLLAGFAIGFGGLYFWTKQREPQIVQAVPPRLVLPSASGPSEPPEPQGQVPPVDLAEVQKLQDKVKANPKDFEALVELGNIDFDQRNYSDAAGYYTRALAVRDDPNVRTDLGTMLFYSKRYDEAMTELNKVLAANPTHAQALFNLGVVLLHGKEDPEGALRTWQKLLDTNPNFPQADAVRQQVKSLKESLKK
jgi:cytochrome c-type biogenesis protein CcmH/NrfG